MKRDEAEGPVNGGGGLRRGRGGGWGGWRTKIITLRPIPNSSFPGYDCVDDLFTSPVGCDLTR